MAEENSRLREQRKTRQLQEELERRVKELEDEADEAEAQAEEQAEELEILQRRLRAQSQQVIIAPGVSRSVQVSTPGTVIDYRRRR